MPVPDAQRIAAVCAVAGVRADVLPAAGAGVVVVPQAATDGIEVTRALSRMLRDADLLLLVRTAGQVTAERWRGAALQDTPPAGLALAGLPQVVEQLLLSDVPAADVDGAVSTGSQGGRLPALWRLVRSSRRPS